MECGHPGPRQSGNRPDAHSPVSFLSSKDLCIRPSLVQAALGHVQQRCTLSSATHTYTQTQTQTQTQTHTHTHTQVTHRILSYLAVLGTQKHGRAWAWRKFAASVPVPPSARGRQMEIICKAVDEGYNTQPGEMQAIYNFRGIVVNAWQRLKVPVAPK